MTMEIRCCKCFFFELFIEDIGGRYIRAAPVVKKERKHILVAFFPQQRTNKCVSISRLARSSHISRPCCEHCDENVGQIASPARPVDIPCHSRSLLSSVSAADEESRCLEVSFRLLFLRPIWPNMCPRCIIAFCYY